MTAKEVNEALAANNMRYVRARQRYETTLAKIQAQCRHIWTQRKWCWTKGNRPNWCMRCRKEQT